MPTYLHPGVYIEEIPSGAKPIEGVGTSTAAFIGYTTKGPIAEPNLIFKWDTYDQIFGGIRDTGKAQEGDSMGYAVYSFFLNGGTAAYIVRAVQNGSVDSAEGFLKNPADTNKIVKFTAANPGEWGNDLRVEFATKTGSSDLFVLQVGVTEDSEFKELEKFGDLSMDESAPNFIENKVNDASQLIQVEVQDVSRYLLGVSRSQDLSEVSDFSSLNEKSMTVTVDGTVRSVTFAAESFDDSSTLDDVQGRIQEAVRGSVVVNPAVADFTCVVQDNTLVLTSGTRLKTSSVVVTGTGDDSTDAAKVLLLGIANDGEERTGQESLNALLSGIPGEVNLKDGSNGSEPDKIAYDAVFSMLKKCRDINILCLPGQTWDTTGEKSIIDAAVAHAQDMKSRIVIIDPAASKELKTETDVTAFGFKANTYSVVYYPWVKVANPFYHAETNPGVPQTVLVGPSGFSAGMWAKTDGRRGVWKAPAGMETSLLGVAGLQYIVEDGEQDQLNPLGINCLRKMPAAGPVIWGSRTLSTKTNPEWRYVPVRRTAIFIEQSIYNGIQWAVFEPNDHRLWSSLRLNIDSFMNGLFRSGAFQGEKASDAYFVRCGLGDTMTQGDIDRGQVIVIVGFAPLKPAEFVIVRIQQKVAQQ